jgi:hypothetical protein
VYHSASYKMFPSLHSGGRKHKIMSGGMDAEDFAEPPRRRGRDKLEITHHSGGQARKYGEELGQMIKKDKDFNKLVGKGFWKDFVKGFNMVMKPAGAVMAMLPDPRAKALGVGMTGLATGLDKLAGNGRKLYGGANPSSSSSSLSSSIGNSPLSQASSNSPLSQMSPLELPPLELPDMGEVQLVAQQAQVNPQQLMTALQLLAQLQQQQQQQQGQGRRRYGGKMGSPLQVEQEKQSFSSTSKSKDFAEHPNVLGGKRKLSKGASDWISFVKKVANDKNIPYREALKVASKMRR